LAESVELAAVAAYDAAARGKAADIVTGSAAAFADQHRAHARAFGDMAGAAASSQPNRQLVEDLRRRLREAGGERSAVRVLFELEERLAATHLVALGILESLEALRLTAAVLPVETRHAVGLGLMIDAGPSELLPAFESTDAAVDAEQFPVD
jgi:Ferritin-like domain